MHHPDVWHCVLVISHISPGCVAHIATATRASRTAAQVRGITPIARIRTHVYPCRYQFTCHVDLSIVRPPRHGFVLHLFGVVGCTPYLRVVLPFACPIYNRQAQLGCGRQCFLFCLFIVLLEPFARINVSSGCSQQLARIFAKCSDRSSDLDEHHQFYFAHKCCYQVRFIIIGIHMFICMHVHTL